MVKGKESVIEVLFFFTLYRIQRRNEYQLEIHAKPDMKNFDDIINFLVKNKIFLHIKIRWNSSISRITDKFLHEQIVRYTPSEEHRKKCKDDLCHINARLEFIDSDGFVFNSKSF